MASLPIEPLRIQKGAPGMSPTKFPTATSKPLSDVSPMAIRRNSPSFPGGNKGGFLGKESSPFNSSPQTMNNATSPRVFWQGRDPTSPARENQSPYDSTSPAKRSSIENLKKASRVKNSSMFAREQNNNYDPSNPKILDRPLATGRPLSMQFQGNAFGGQGLHGFQREADILPAANLELPETEMDDQAALANAVAPLSPSKNKVSPAKSSLSRRTGANATKQMGFDPSTGIWADDDPSEKQLPEGKGLHRHAKSVTFDRAPPQINEYEMTTPDPSSVASGSREGSYDSGEEDEDLSFERGSSFDRDDSFDASLEDTDKTPVVLPEDWRFMSPETANTDLVRHEEDVFGENDYGSPAPGAHPGVQEYREHQTSINSVDSNGQPRPLPPLPNLTSSPERRNGLSSSIERMSNAQRFLPSPPQAAGISKSDVRRMSAGSMSLEDRLRLMMLQEQEQQEDKSEVEKQRERRMRRAGSKEASPARDFVHEEQDVHSEEGNGSPGPSLIEDAEAPPISRDSILRRLRSQQDLQDHSEVAPMHSGGVMYDPDIAIPSLEDPTQFMRLERGREVTIKREELDENDLYSIPDLYNQPNQSESGSEDATSQYSQSSSYPQFEMPMEEGQETPRAQSPAREPEKKSLPSERMSLPEFTGFGDESSFDLGFSSYMTPPTEQKSVDTFLPPAYTTEPTLPDLSALRASIQRPYTPEEQLSPPRFSMSRNSANLEPGTPDSVIHHLVTVDPEPEVAEPEATIKAPGSHLKTRPSFTPPDVDTMAAMRRQVSAQVPAPSSTIEPSEEQYQSAGETDSAHEQVPSEPENIPTQEPNTDSTTKQRLSSLVQLEIPRDQSDEGLGLGLEKEFDRVLESQKVEFEKSLQHLYYPFVERLPSSEVPASKDTGKKHPLQDVPLLPHPCGGQPPQGVYPSLDLRHYQWGTSFANPNRVRQRGYLMRHNTKVVVASERISQDEPRVNDVANSQSGSSAPSAAASNEVQVSPRKISQPTWTAEPWNGRARRKSIRVGGEQSPSKRKPVEGPVPPLPGQLSNVTDGMDTVAEEDLGDEEAEDIEDGIERGRLFVKVVGVKDLDLPIPQYERTSFALTLDNGLHCVTTAWLDLSRSAPIGQEFELIVLNDLEFQLTLQMKLEEPKPQRPASPIKAPSSPKKQGAFGRLFGSPKKRKESELKAQQEAARRPVTPPSAYEMVQGIVAKDGAFARAYVALSEHEKQAYGRPYTVDIACFNEWAMEEVHVGSSRSKKSVTQLQRRPPYPTGKLELQLLYIPKPKGAKDEDMPKSMNGAVRELRDAEVKMTQQLNEFEGHLSQQGGDCPYWRRRFFKLVGTKLTAYHEATLQPRATINLAKAAKLIDDKSTLMQRETTTKGGGRRKSAFAEEEEGYMFVEEGFRIRFANGEVIDFYADSAHAKDEWMKVLSQVVGKGPSAAAAPIKLWADAVLRREKMEKAKKQKPTAVRTDTSDSLTREQTVVRNPNARTNGFPVERPNLPPPPSSIPSPTRTAPRPQAHTRTESYQPQSGSRSQAGSPVKSRVSKEERHNKTKSMIDMQFR